MPALSPTMTEGKLTRWLKSEGDVVKPGQVVAEIETDKATMEVEAVDEGKIGKILVAAGTENVAVNSPIAVLLEEGEGAGDIKSASSAPKVVASKPEAEPAATETYSQPVTAAQPTGKHRSEEHTSELQSH